MESFKTFFHQAQPKVIGGFAHMRTWLGHDKEPEELHEDLKWWMTDQQHGLCRRSVQAENISAIGWLLCSTKDINCAALQASIEKRLGDKQHKAGCRFKMMSLGGRGAAPKENQIKATHVECDTTVHFDVKVASSKIHVCPRKTTNTQTACARDLPQGLTL